MDILSKVNTFYKNFEGNKGVIGFSVQGRPIYYFEIKKSVRPTLIVQCAIHAREHITTRLCLKLINDFNKYGKRGTVYFIPLTNPDGVNIATNFNPLYKANARGVDLNVNFDARWGTGKSNVRVFGAENCIGEYPFSEPESRAIRDFTLDILPNATISYHSKGEEIYYGFLGSENNLRDKIIAQKIGCVTGYKVKTTPLSAGGYKDWCVCHLKIPSFTIEVGRDELNHPLKGNALKDVYQKNKRVITVLTENLWT